MNRIILIAIAACLVAGPADARRRHHHRHDYGHSRYSSFVRAAVIIYVLRERDCPRAPSQPTLCYWRTK